MRADRLIGVLMLLQRHGRVTTAQVAEALEISERTARRDLEALGMAGVPVYPTRGRGGGWQLVGGARTDLTGLTGPEVRALFLAAGSAPGQPPEVRAALAKLQRAVPAPFREEAARATETVFVDRPGHLGSGTPGGLPTARPDHLAAAQDAITRGRRAELTYRARTGEESVRVIDPLGLVDRGNAWYLVADTAAGRRTFRVDRARSLTLLEEPVRRPEGFDLAATWREIAIQIEDRRFPESVEAHVRPWVLRILQRFPDLAIRAVGPADEDGWHTVSIAGWSVMALTGQLAGFAPACEVTDPPEARELLAHIGRDLVRMYAEP